MLKQKYFLTGIFILSAERQPIKLAWRKIVWLHEIGESDIDFSKVSNINGIYFDYDEDDKLWKITCMNPYVVFT